MTTVSVNMRIDRELKCQAEELFHEMGFTLTSAVTSFLRQSVQEQGFPYRPSVRYSKELIESCREAEREARDPSTPRYHNSEELKAAIEAL
ncbi:MAG: type II toxin-antitoxin system RelB/DinJ family antitoxin [Firmicutes bacterium]|nr:type II toxin-antitoxin system RelB/DinJ family antitoxin [Bacillota bacterium]